MIPLNLDIALSGLKALRVLSTRKKPTFAEELAKFSDELIIETFKMKNHTLFREIIINFVFNFNLRSQ